MAIRDHTVRIRSSVPPDDTLNPPCGDPPSTAAVWPETLRDGARGDIALAVLALTRLRVDSEQCRHAQARGFPGRPLSWPLPVAVSASLGTANRLFAEQTSLTQERKLWEIALAAAQADLTEGASKLTQAELQLTERQGLVDQLTAQASRYTTTT